MSYRPVRRFEAVIAKQRPTVSGGGAEAPPPMDPVTQLRLGLYHAGYSPLPVQGKVPTLKSWQDKLESNPAEIKLWGKTFAYAENTRILTAFVPTLDIDILDPVAAQAVEDLARERFEERGYVLVRTGKAPKRAVLLRTDVPFKKFQTAVIAPNGSDGQKIELLGDGQQLVVFGIHPETKKPYQWHGGSAGACGAAASATTIPLIH